MPPNILWLMTDQHRLDCVGAYSDRPVHTPNLDRLAAQSVVFDRHYSTCPLCVPARSSLHTGRFPHSCGATINGFGQGAPHEPGVLNDGEITIGERLVQAGYHVGYIGVDHVRTAPPLGHRGDFAEYTVRGAYRAYLRQRGLELPDTRAHQHECPTRFEGGAIRPHFFSAPNPGRHPFEAEDFEDFYFANRAARFVEQAPADRPFFLMCFLWMPHPPFVTPEPYCSMYSPDDIRLPANVPGNQVGKPPIHLEHLPGQVGAGRSETDWREAWAAYYGCVTLADTCIGRVLDAAGERSGRDETLIIFHPDHGEMLGAHQYFQKMVCYEEAIHVPMMVSAPGVQPGRRGCLTSHVDITPTILEYAGEPVPGSVQGRSLRGVLTDPSARHHQAVFSEYNGNVIPDLYQRCIVFGDHKYIWNDGDIDELYDLTQDPLEERNLANAPAYTGVRDDMRGRLAEWMRQTGDFIELG